MSVKRLRKLVTFLIKMNYHQNLNMYLLRLILLTGQICERRGRNMIMISLPFLHTPNVPLQLNKIEFKFIYFQ